MASKYMEIYKDLKSQIETGVLNPRRKRSKVKLISVKSMTVHV